MNSRILIIYEYQILYQILNEISEDLNFEITQSNSKDLKELKYDPKNNYLVVSKKKIGFEILILSSILRAFTCIARRNRTFNRLVVYSIAAQTI